MSLLVLRGFQFVIPLITLPYLVRTVGIEKFGLVNYALSLGLYFGALIQFGFGITASREIARHREDTDSLSCIYSVTLSCSILLALLGSSIYALIVMSIESFRNFSDLYLFTLIFVVFQSIFPYWFFQGVEKMKFITFLSLGTSLMNLLGLLIFVKDENDYILIPLLNAAASLVTFLFAVTVIRTQFKVQYKRPSIQEIKATLGDGWYAFIAQFVPNIYTNTVTFLLGVFANTTTVGVFVAATKITDAAASLVYVFSDTFLPFLSRHIDKHKLFQKLMILIGLGVAIVVFFGAEIIASLMYGDADKEVVTYIELLSLAIPMIFIQVTFGKNYLMLVGQEATYKNILLLFSSLSLTYSIPLIYAYGAWGSIFTLIFTRVLISVFSYKAYRHHISSLIT